MGHQQMLAAVISGAYGVLDNTDGETVITADGTLTINADSDMSFQGYVRDPSAGVFTDSRGRRNLVKNGTENLVLGGLQFAFSGATIFIGGSLYLGSAVTASTGNATFGAAANATLNTGTANGYTGGTLLLVGENMLGSGILTLASGIVSADGATARLFSNPVTATGNPLIARRLQSFML